MAIDSEEKLFRILEYALDKENSFDRYVILSESRDDFYGIEKTNDEWIVYYRERGAKRIEGKFSTAHLAASFFFWRLTKPIKYTDYLSEYETLAE